MLKIVVAATFPEAETAILEGAAFVLMPAGEPHVWERKVNGKLEVLPVKTNTCTVMVRPDMEEKREFKALRWKWVADYVPQATTTCYALCQPDGTFEDVKAALDRVVSKIRPGREHGARTGRRT